MALLTKSYLFEKAKKSSPWLSEANVRAFSAEQLAAKAKAATDYETFDVFLSHSMEDAILIKGLRDELADQGYRVYVDWIEDPQLDRTTVTKETAAALRSRMRQSRSLLFATSESSKKSIWMPWELGYMDAFLNSRVAIAPIVDADSNKEFKGQEYLGLYPYLDRTGSSLYIQNGIGLWVRFAEWLAGKDPHAH